VPYTSWIAAAPAPAKAGVDFGRLHTMHRAGAFFVTRAKSNMKAHRLYSAAVDRATGVVYDQTIVLDGHYARKGYPERLHRIRYNDAETGKALVFLTNHFELPALTIAALYKNRWQWSSFSTGSSARGTSGSSASAWPTRSVGTAWHRHSPAQAAGAVLEAAGRRGAGVTPAWPCLAQPSTRDAAGSGHCASTG
jgi:hypothetical protein